MEEKTTITVFSHGVTETPCETWERYKSMLRRCPRHGFRELAEINMFRNGLQQQPKLLLDSTVGGSLMSKGAKYATAIIKRLKLSDHQRKQNRIPIQRKNGIIESNINDRILARKKLLTQKVDELAKN